MRKRIEFDGDLDVTGPRGSLQVRGAGERLTVRATELSALMALKPLTFSVLRQLDTLPPEMVPPVDVFLGKRRIVRVEPRSNSWLGKLLLGNQAMSIMPGSCLLALVGMR